MPLGRALILTTSSGLGLGSAILAYHRYQDRSSSNEQPLCTSKLNTASERTVSRYLVRVLGDQGWAGDSDHGNGGVRTDANDDSEVLADGCRAV